MTLGEIVKQYRVKHNLSLRDFSKLCGLSNGYISMLEKNENPRSKKPIVPSLDTVRVISETVGISLDDLLEMMNGQEIALKAVKKEDFVLSAIEREIIMEYRKSDEITKSMVLRILSIDESLDGKGDATKMA